MLKSRKLYRRTLLVISFLMCFLLPFLNFPTSRAGTYYNSIQLNTYGFWGMLKGETQYFVIYNDVQTHDMTIDLTPAGTPNSATHVRLTVSRWPWSSSSQVIQKEQSESINADCQVTFQCEEKKRYIVKIENLLTTNNMEYNITYTSGDGIYLFYQGPPTVVAEQYHVPDTVSINYYFKTDPWLYDGDYASDRLNLMLGYDPYFEFKYITYSGERWFLIHNYDEDIELFVGVTGYPIEDYLCPTPSMNLYVYDWADLNANPDAELPNFEGEAYIFSEYSGGFTFTCKKDHVYQVKLENGDSACSLFANVTFYTYGDANIRLDHDLNLDPIDDQIKVRIYNYDPWLEFRQYQRQIMWWWILGGGGIIGLGFAVFMIKMRL